MPSKPHRPERGASPPAIRSNPPLCLVTGGQTGVDRAALDVAMALGLPCGGWCPRGRRAEDGPIPQRYPLLETDSPEYAQRTEWNVRDSQGTLILTRGEPTGGTALTAQWARQYRRPLLVVDLSQSPKSRPVVDWLCSHGIGMINVAGPRESVQPGISRQAGRFLRNVVKCYLRIKQGQRTPADGQLNTRRPQAP